jgi:hypothetical protein
MCECLVVEGHTYIWGRGPWGQNFLWFSEKNPNKKKIFSPLLHVDPG